VKKFVLGVIVLGVVTIELLLHVDENEPLEGLEEGGAEASLLLGGVYAILNYHNGCSVRLDGRDESVS
jgi:hypothetical protein